LEIAPEDVGGGKGTQNAANDWGGKKKLKGNQELEHYA
jgi:hypothetical protein